MNKRIKTIFLIFIVAWAGLAYRLFYIQIYKSSQFKEIARNQHYRHADIDYYRGDILDRKGNILATDLTYYSFAADPKLITDKWKAAVIFSKHFDKSRDHYLTLLRKNKSFVWLERKVPAGKADTISEYGLKGIRRLTDYKRFYPNSYITGQITGFTDIDNLGIEGLELRYNDLLAGQTGKKAFKSDALGRKTVDFNYPIEEAVDGKNIVTTIDLDCQTIALEELSKGVEKFNAKSGMVILMDPRSGEILALASAPTFDCNEFGKYRPESRRNRAVTDSFEPGSIFKLIPIAAALEEKLVIPQTKFFCENGHIMVGSHRFRDTKAHDTLSVKEIMEKSSNIGAYKIAQKLGPEKYYKYILDFGFSRKTGIELGGEASGYILKPSRWSRTSLPSISIGQEITANSLQITAAYGAVANGGMLMKPYLIKAIYDNNGKPVETFSPTPIKRVISKKTADILTTFFEGVVDHGTAKKAKISGKSIAGKTGTAQKVDPVRKAYSQTDYMSSFVAFYPSKNPRLVGLVVLDTPKPRYYGGDVAAPILKNIINRLSYIPGNDVLADEIDLIELNKSEKITFWQRVQSLWKDSPGKESNETTANNQQIDNSAETLTAEKTTHFIDIKKVSNKSKDNKENSEKPEKILVTVPDVKGKPIRDAVKVLLSKGLDFRIKGAGVVMDQFPAPGEKARPGTVTILKGKSTEELFNN
ncbi:MAG: transpeptidase family protein [bacterium]|nr:transpeptidase family protein [bacterium]